MKWYNSQLFLKDEHGMKNAFGVFRECGGTAIFRVKLETSYLRC